ncbi:hypothetical protein [Actinomadura chokoriensis]|uniref:hypothetical protein n=1 Tax=Actinomadura chokoriensis TaxID=454156 RepID=UPI0031F9089A
MDLTSGGLRVVNEHVPGCCAEVVHPSVRITCRKRREDSGNPWFWTSWREPIAPADRITDASVVILGYLTARPETGRPNR